MGVLVGIIFSHTPDEAKSGGLAKACVPGKNYSVSEKIELLNNMDYLLVNLRILIDPLFFYRRDPLVATGTTFYLLHLVSSLYQSPLR